MATYTRTNFKAALKGMIGKEIDSLNDPNETINRAARDTFADVHLRSAKRKAAASPNLFNDVYDYACPTDLAGNGLIDVQPQVNRPRGLEVRLTSQEEFDRLKTVDQMLAAFSDDSLARKLRISFLIDDDNLVISELDSLTSGGGTWEVFSTGATNITADLDNFVKGSGSLNWDISATGGQTTAGIKNDSVDAFDIDEFTPAGSAFVWVYITSTTNLTNFILRLGQDDSNFYYKTVTTTHEGNAFAAGWNLLRFDLQSLSETGSPEETDLEYVAIYMTKAAAKVSETDYRFDWLVLKRGKIHYVWYYSKFPWQSSAGTWIIDSTAEGDYLNVDNDELGLVLDRAAWYAKQELEAFKKATEYEKSYGNKKLRYVQTNPSEAKVLTTTYYNF